jgi:hypothetical protein
VDSVIRLVVIEHPSDTGALRKARNPLEVASRVAVLTLAVSSHAETHRRKARATKPSANFLTGQFSEPMVG